MSCIQASETDPPTPLRKGGVRGSRRRRTASPPCEGGVGGVGTLAARPLGALGMLGLVALAELFVSRNTLLFMNATELDWMSSGGRR